MSKFQITKTREYVWKVNNRFGYADMVFITAWHVFDANTDEVVIGGHSTGANWKSGTATITRKKDAQAWINGYAAAERGDDIKFRDGLAWISYAQRKAYGLDSAQAEFFTLGAALYFTTGAN